MHFSSKIRRRSGYKKRNVPKTIIDNAIRQLNRNTSTHILVNHILTEEIQIIKNIEGYSLGTDEIKIVRNAHDAVGMAENKDDLQRLL